MGVSSLPILLVIIAVVLLTVLAAKTPIIRGKLVARRLLYIGTILIIVWLSVAIILSLIDKKLNIIDAIYWSFAMGMSAEPLRNPPSNPLTHFVLLFDSGVSIIMLALIMTAVVEYYLNKLFEYSKGLHTEVKNAYKHIVFVGFSKASEKAYVELKARLKNKKFVVLDIPDKSDYIKKMLEPEVDEFVGGVPYEEESLERTHLWTADAIIISLDDDSKSILALLRIKNIIQKHREEANKQILIVVEALKDENSRLIKAAYGGSDQNVTVKVVVSRSLVGRLMASAIIEPSVLVFLEDATSIVHGIVAFTVKRTGELLGIESETSFRDLIGALMDKNEALERAIPLAVIRRNRNQYKLIINPKLEEKILPSDNVILLSYTRKEIEKNRNYIYSGVLENPSRKDYGYYIDNYSWIKRGSVEKLWEINKTRGHIAIIGYTEAIEALIDELTSVSRTLSESIDGRIAPGERVDKTIILLTDRNPQKYLENTVIVPGELLSEDSLRKAGVLTADVIVVSTDLDYTTTHVLLHIRDLILSTCEPRLERMYERGRDKYNEIVSIAEVDTSDIASILINNGLSDVAIPSRSFGGVLLAYAVKNPEVFSFIEDITSATEGEGDLREIIITRALIGDRSELAFEELLYLLKKTRNSIPLALVTKIVKGDEKENVIIYVPDPKRKVKIGDRVVVLAPSRRLR